MPEQNAGGIITWVRNYARNDTKAFVCFCLAIAVTISFMLYVKANQATSLGLLGSSASSSCIGRKGQMDTVWSAENWMAGWVLSIRSFWH